MRLLIKICGLRTIEALKAAEESGADAIGFMAYPKSKRFIAPEDIAALLKEAPLKGVRKAGVFVDPTLDDIKRYLDAGIDLIQLHGSESAGFAREAGKLAEVWKAFGPESDSEIDAMRNYPAAKILVDAFNPREKGGTGTKADWTLARYAAETLPQGAILAGGLTPGNVAEALKAVRPAGVDVSSGVEAAPGVKDAALIRAFVKAAREATSR